MLGTLGKARLFGRNDVHIVQQYVVYSASLAWNLKRSIRESRMENAGCSAAYLSDQRLSGVARGTMRISKCDGSCITPLR